MTTALILNIVLAALAFGAVLGLLTWTIVTDRTKVAAGRARARRQRAVAPARVLGVSLD